MKTSELNALDVKLKGLWATDKEVRPTEFSKDIATLFQISEPLKRQEKLYLKAMSYLAAVAIEGSKTKVGRDLGRRLDDGIEEYMPGYPPMSPVTDSLFYSNLFISFRYGAENETATERIVQLLNHWKADPAAVDVIRRMGHSRLGIFQTVKIENGFIVARELVAEREFRLYNNSKHQESVGQLRLSRIAVPVEKDGDVFFEITTPYVLIGADAAAWTRYLNDNLPESANRPDPLYGPLSEQPCLPKSDLADRLASLFEDDCGEMRWFDFVMDGYSNHTPAHITLHGIPNRPETLPHNDAYVAPRTSVLPSPGRSSPSTWHKADTPAFQYDAELFDEYGEYSEQVLADYFGQLTDQFVESPEFAELGQKQEEYINLLYKYGVDYFGTTPATLTDADLHEILFEIIPRKVVLEPESAKPLVAEFRAFFLFAARQFSSKVASKLAGICNSNAAKEMKKALSDSSNFGMAKSFFSAGKAAGFDMCSEADLAAFSAMYNANLPVTGSLNEVFEPAQGRMDVRDAFSDERPVLVREKPAIGRNEVCPCGSGKKYKKCCLKD